MSKKETVVCMECGTREELCWDLPTNRRLKEHRRCFTCDHFLALLEGFPKDSLRIDGGHYMVGPEDKSPNVFRGFGGRRFVIERFTGERIATTNLWHQGIIPEHLRERMPDNARFVKET